MNIPQEFVDMSDESMDPRKSHPIRKRSMSTIADTSSHELPQQKRAGHSGSGSLTTTAVDTRAFSENGLSARDGVVGRSALQMEEDERQARELNAALNRNLPRRRGYARPGEQEPNQGRSPRSPEFGENGSYDMYETPQIDGESSPCRNGDHVGNTMDGTEAGWDENGSEGSNGHRWLTTVGQAAEVWWGKAWYRCYLHSVAGDGRYGVLEFVSRKKSRRAGRSYSTELDLEEWIADGHLVRPQTHLEWD